MKRTSESIVVGTFGDRVQAGRAVQKLMEVGFREGQVRVTASHSFADDSDELTAGTHADMGAIMGAVVGAGCGGMIGVAILAGFLPAFRDPSLTGTIATMLVSGTIGAALSGLLGLLIGWSIRKPPGNHYADRLERGGLVVTVQADGQLDVALAVLDSFGAAKQ